ncbi:DUF4136 domain-containing protein [Flavobacterium johnsoniae]|uniref:Hypothetical lipoprotein n=1 Tax=Flavobacterium johnsoniae (strain ATCC 17061 / DSM 2064 / JCM 8514 / BCRC 14874 / CCUG 350202 / NBRC 14942 / NCIMB 11054 / UW101) TaxID=376686 RepID=A5FKU1_FLAJ1|nr:DUF4136 domain-containing protein [Flavobacterium johnsoniae]ABQ04179.1 hypothetical lipoprotein [Flavobacterium johnsoniae UW101]OXG02587.1 hypothetical protein B0A63_02735 [Flavobacterium johnsoniae UW101]WQG84026.1 DUF4136 domain-containing protein [Flavobacterium johnsoniae UW101]SHK14722.1 protein of unknown function [Flavobacterium johnsoniae]
MNIKRTNLRIIPILFLGLIYSCSPTVRVTTDYDHAANFGEYKTFAVYDLKAKQGQVNQLNVDRVTNAIRAEMIAKGFKESDNPDLKVNAVSILKNKTSVSADTNFYGYGGMYRPYGYWGGGAMMGGANTTFNTYDYVDGSLVIDIVSTKSQKLVWQGIGNAEIDSKPDNPEEFINNSIKKILAGFPPGAEKK